MHTTTTSMTGTRMSMSLLSARRRHNQSWIRSLWIGLALISCVVNGQTPSSSVNGTIAPSLAPSEAPSTAPPTDTPTVSATTFGPTASPSAAPTAQATTDAPSAAPAVGSPAPTTSVAPSTGAPVTPAPTTATTTVTPTVPPSPSPSEAATSASPAPTDSPTSPPTPRPTSPPSRSPSRTPSASPSEFVSTATPSSSPSNTPPTMRPTPSPTSEATTPLISPPVFTGLTMSLTGVNTLSTSSVATWEKFTAEFVQQYYTNRPTLGVSDLTASLDVTSQEGGSSRRRLTRNLQQALTLTFDQTITYRTSDSSITPEFVVENPFSTSAVRTVYVNQLKETGDSAFANLQSVSSISMPEESSSDDGMSLWTIVGIAVGGAVGLLLLGGGVFYLSSRKKSPRTGYVPTTEGGGGVGGAPVSSLRLSAAPDEVSTLAEPTLRTSGAPTIAYGDQSVATVDYDYSKAYGGGGDTTVSSAGGTFGSQTHLTTSADDPHPVTAGGSFSDDASFDTQYRDPGTSVKEELIDVYAPAGKLGVVIDTPDDGAPVVHAIKDSSIIADKLQVGDKLVMVDDEDVTCMTAIKVSKLISRKSANATRKLSIIRTTVAD